MTRPLALLLAAAALVVVAGAAPAPALMPVAMGVASVTAVALVATTLAARRLSITRTLSAHEACECEPIRLDFDVAGLGRLPVTIEAHRGSGAWTPVGAGLELAVPRRGALRLAPTELRVRDRFGIADRYLTAGQPERLLILPAPDERLPLGAPASGPGDPEPDGLQAYAPGIPMARIHWRALARGAGLHARREAPGQHELPLIVVDTSGELRPGAIDWAARAAAGHVLRLARNGGCRVVLPGHRDEITVPDVAAWPAMHRRLALLEAAPAAPALPAAVRIAAAAATSIVAPPSLPHGVELT